MDKVEVVAKVLELALVVFQGSLIFEMVPVGEVGLVRESRILRILWCPFG